MTIGILLVDDSDFMRGRIRTILDEGDYEIVAEAVDGADAVRAYKQHAEAVDIVLMDIVMSKANGIKATAAIKQLDPDARIVMCTSVGQHKKMKLAARAGADGYVTKPFEDTEIVDAIDTVLA